MAASCSFRYATAFAWFGLRTSRDPNEASAAMCSSSFAGSMRSRIALIGLAVGDGDGVGERVAVGGALAATNGGDEGDDDAGPAQAETTIARPGARGRVRPGYFALLRGAPAPAGSRPPLGEFSSAFSCAYCSLQKTTFPSCASTKTVSPSLNSPERTFCASGSMMSRWIVRLIGRAP